MDKQSEIDNKIKVVFDNPELANEINDKLHQEMLFSWMKQHIKESIENGSIEIIREDKVRHIDLDDKWEIMLDCSFIKPNLFNVEQFKFEKSIDK